MNKKLLFLLITIALSATLALGLLAGCTEEGVAETGETVITSVETLNAAMAQTGDEYTGWTFSLDTDISISDGSFSPWGATAEAPFSGTFDGRGHTVSVALDTLPDSGAVGLFGYVKNATVKNLTVNLYLSDKALLNKESSYIGGLAGFAFGTNIVENVKVFMSCEAKMSYNTRIDRNMQSNWYSENSQYVGGIFGSATGTLIIKSSDVNSMTLKAADEVNAKETYYSDINRQSLFVGGVVGHVGGQSVLIEDCVVRDLGVNLLADSVYFGGVVGSIEAGSIKNTTVEMAKTAYIESKKKGYAGGFAGYAYESEILSNSYSAPESAAFLISTYNYNPFNFGGAVGYLDGRLNSVKARIENCNVTAHAKLGNATAFSSLVGVLRNAAARGNTVGGTIYGYSGGAVILSELQSMINTKRASYGTVAATAYGSAVISGNNVTGVTTPADFIVGVIEAYVPVDSEGNEGVAIIPAVS